MKKHMEKLESVLRDYRSGMSFNKIAMENKIPCAKQVRDMIENHLGEPANTRNTLSLKKSLERKKEIDSLPTLEKEKLIKQMVGLRLSGSSISYISNTLNVPPKKVKSFLEYYAYEWLDPNEWQVK